jgi:hypothetical protein
MNDLQHLNVRDITWLLYNVVSSNEIKKPQVSYDKKTENEN